MMPLRRQALIAFGLLAASVLAETAPVDTWSRTDAESLCLRWCDALVGLQVKSADPALDGALHCPACGFFHGRIADVVWPMSWAFVKTGDQKYLSCARSAVSWAERNMLRAGGYYVNDQQSKWIYTTVFSQIAFGRAITRFRADLPKEVLSSWERIFRRQSEFLLGYLTTPGNNPNVNYLAAFCEAMGYAWKLTGENRFRAAGLEMAERRVLPLFNEEGFLIGEGDPVDGVSADRGLPFIDIAYNLEESLPSLAAAADIFGHSVLADAVRKSARAHAAFMLPDGGMDAVTGSRAVKWTYYGSRTSDGALPLWAWCVRKGEPWAVRMIDRTLSQLRTCTSVGGLLYGGPDYARAGEPACVHHTFTHVKALAELLSDPPADSAAQCPLPRESAKGALRLSSMDVDLVSVGLWRATFSANDAPKGRTRRLALGGGSLALLWHESIGPIVVGTPARFFFVEGHNMQDQRHDSAERCMTPRLECRTAAGVFSNLPDRKVRVASEMKDGAFVYVAEGTLTAADDQAFLTNGTYRIEWRLSAEGMDVTAQTSVPCALVFPVRDVAADALEIVGDTALAVEKTDRGRTAFSTAGGFLYRYLTKETAMSHRLRLGLKRAKTEDGRR